MLPEEVARDMRRVLWAVEATARAGTPDTRVLDDMEVPKVGATAMTCIMWMAGAWADSLDGDIQGVDILHSLGHNLEDSISGMVGRGNAAERGPGPGLHVAYGRGSGPADKENRPRLEREEKGWRP